MTKSAYTYFSSRIVYAIFAKYGLLDKPYANMEYLKEVADRRYDTWKRSA